MSKSVYVFVSGVCFCVCVGGGVGKYLYAKTKIVHFKKALKYTVAPIMRTGINILLTFGVIVRSPSSLCVCMCGGVGGWMGGWVWREVDVSLGVGVGVCV